MSFFKTTLATVTGIFISFFLMFLLLLIIVASSSSESEPYIRDGSVLNIPISGIIMDRAVEDPFAEVFSPGSSNRVTMDVFRSNIKKAKSDKRVAGIRLDLDNVGGSWSNLTEMRELLIDFKADGKFIYGYINDLGINEAAYYIATVADSIFAQPETYFELDGFYVERQFYKNAFDKYGLQADVITTGKYKSAADDYRSASFSDGDREQLREILNERVVDFTNAVATYSGYTNGEVNAIMNGAPNILIANALERGLIDGLKFPFEFDDFLKERTAQSTLQDVSFGRYTRVKDTSAGLSRPTGKEIAVIYAEGPIMPELPMDIFGGSTQMVTYNKLKNEFEKVLKDNNVAAIVVRIDSPGGAVTTSEIIRGLIADAATKKPVVASMSSVAASGGYYIAMGADTVVAQKGTITGSIGVVMAKLSYGDFLEKQFGITHDQIKTHSNADWFSPVNALTAQQRRALENIADVTYDNFLQLVADARGMEKEQIHRLAQGRVWSADAALEVGLIDAIATLDEAIEIAAQMAGIESYTVGSYPTPKTFLETLMESGNTRLTSIFKQTLDISPNLDAVLREVRSTSRPQVYSIFSSDISVN